MLTRLTKATKDREEGFTLIELLVVIIIIGILAAIAIPVFLNQRKKGVDASMKADIRQAATTAETYTTSNPTAANFGATPAAILANFGANGMQNSPGNLVEVAGGPVAGYCLRVSNPSASAGASAYFWYDSTGGGLQPGTATTTKPSTTACAAATTFSAVA